MLTFLAILPELFMICLQFYAESSLVLQQQISHVFTVCQNILQGKVSITP